VGKVLRSKYSKVLFGNMVTEIDKPEKTEPETIIDAVCNVITTYL
jgi:hypothetical protein